MKKNFLFIVLFTVIGCISCSHKTITDNNLHPVENTTKDYKHLYDSVCLELDSAYKTMDSIEYHCDSVLTKLDTSLTIAEFKIILLHDSINTLNSKKDSTLYYKNKYEEIKEENFVLNYKLERIREYNRIAAKGNNITFLRGWINRVLNDK